MAVVKEIVTTVFLSLALRITLRISTYRVVTWLR